MSQHGEEGDWIAEEGSNSAQLVVAPMPPIRVQKCLYLFEAEPKSQRASRYPSYYGILGDIVRNNGSGTNNGTVPNPDLTQDHGSSTNPHIRTNQGHQRLIERRVAGVVLALAELLEEEKKTG